ncbi:MAG: hypothetical protein ABEH65_03450 [Halobacteriales archaeon]
MPPIPPSTFRDHLRAIDRETFITFVRELWRARGYTIEGDEEDDVLVVDDGHGCYRLWIHYRPRFSVRSVPPPTEPVDIVVSNRSAGPSRLPPGDPSLVDPMELRDIALYAIDRNRRQWLFDRLLDLQPVVESESANPASHRRTIVASVLVGVIVATLFAGGWLQGGSLAFGPDSNDRTPMMTPELSPTDSPERPTDTSTAGTTPTPTPIVDADADLPPGLAPSGIVDARALAQRHAQLIAGRSYELELTYREFNDTRFVGSIQETARVERPTVYASRIIQRESPSRDPQIIADSAAYANGTVRVTRDAPDDPRPVNQFSGGEGWYEDRAETYLTWYLSVNESEIISREEQDNRTLYWVRIDEDPWPGIEDSFGRALIDERGIVHYLSVSYDIPGSTTQIVIAIHYTEIGGVTVTPPDWYEATNRTASVDQACLSAGCRAAVTDHDGR